uniref:Uncharacterized protein n=1 Tax=Myotis myotis TaxID=51298 RepID=A0A7J7VYU2_MYOMY|nr:hypothetical protein mMyoMyo1_012293 [Myotis myotis]
MVGIGRSGMVEHVSGVARPREPVTVIRVSLWWLLKILSSHAPWSHLALTPIASPDRPSGLLHLPLLLRGDWGRQPPLTPTAGNGPTCTRCRRWSHCSHPLPTPAPLAPTAGTGPNHSAPSAGASGTDAGVVGAGLQADRTGAVVGRAG